MLKACLIYYNDADLLPMMLESIIEKVDGILAVDGRFDWYPDLRITSNDGSTELLESYGATIVAQGSWSDEMAKRTAYLKAANTNDLLLIIDSDEVLRGYIPDMDHSCSIQVFSYYQGLKIEWRDRIIKKVNGMQYHDDHWDIRPFPNPKLHTTLAASLYHFHFLRTQHRKIQKWTFNMCRQDPIMWRPA